jgi:hypothetical protein
MEDDSPKALINRLWEEHLAAPFPKGLTGVDVNGIDLVLLDSSIAGCVDTYVDSDALNLFQTAMLGLSYRDASFVVPILNKEAAAYFFRLERLAELILKGVAIGNERNTKRAADEDCVKTQFPLRVLFRGNSLSRHQDSLC